MSTVQSTPSVREIVSVLSTEIKECAAGNPTLTGDAVVSCFQNVVLLELRMTIMELPTPLWSIYDDASSRRGVIHEVQELLRALNDIKGRVS